MGLPLYRELQSLILRWDFPSPVRPMALLFDALGAFAPHAVLDFGSPEVRFGNISTVATLNRRQVDLSDPRYAQIHDATLRERKLSESRRRDFHTVHFKSADTAYIANFPRVHDAPSVSSTRVRPFPPPSPIAPIARRVAFDLRGAQHVEGFDLRVGT